jgi:hypothetical protein
MAASEGIDIKNAQRKIVLVDFMRWRAALNDLAEDASVFFPSVFGTIAWTIFQTLILIFIHDISRFYLGHAGNLISEDTSFLVSFF